MWSFRYLILSFSGLRSTRDFSTRMILCPRPAFEIPKTGYTQRDVGAANLKPCMEYVNILCLFLLLSSSIARFFASIWENTSVAENNFQNPNEEQHECVVLPKTNTTSSMCLLFVSKWAATSPMYWDVRRGRWRYERSSIIKMSLLLKESHSSTNRVLFARSLKYKSPLFTSIVEHDFIEPMFSKTQSTTEHVLKSSRT
jgi:hypothetical protein